MSRGNESTVMKIIFVGSMLIAGLLFFMGNAHGQGHTGHGPMSTEHHWFPAECCNGNEEGGDCREVSCGQLKDTREGIVYEMKDGSKVTFTGDQLRPSPDNKCYACFSEWGVTNRDTGKHTTGFTPYCVFKIPPKGV